MTDAGLRVAHVVPDLRANGVALRDVFQRWHGSAALDDDFAAKVDSARAAAAGVDADPERD